MFYNYLKLRKRSSFKNVSIFQNNSCLTLNGPLQIAYKLIRSSFIIDNRVALFIYANK